MKVYDGSIVEDEIFPKQTGYITDGTSFISNKYISEYGTDHLEKIGYKKIDQNASISLNRQFKNGLDKISKEDKYFWAVFLNSVLSRSPKNLILLENTVNEAYAKALQNIYEARLRFGDSSPNQFLEEIKFHSPLEEAQDRAKIQQINHLLEDKFITQIINSPLWINTEIHSNDFLITSDYPVSLIEDPETKKILVIHIALSPKLLQSIYFPSDSTIDFHKSHIQEFIDYHNLIQLQGKPNFIYSDRQLNNRTKIQYTKAMELFLEISNHKSPK